MKIYKIAQHGDMFCTGYCPEFAIALHRLTGLPIYVFNEIEIDEDEIDDEYGIDENYILVHVAVKLTDGRFVDARGIRSEEEIASNLMASDTTPLTGYKLIPYTENELFDEQSIENEAISLADDFIKNNTKLFGGII
tara:strand:+ start:59057 stop:59467 length:411 start_codon:yes stop_codon:yes gene_type:complete